MPAQVGMPQLLAGARTWWDRSRWFLSGVLGGGAYESYLAYHRRSGHTGTPMTKAEYWRARTDFQEANPQGRCC